MQQKQFQHELKMQVVHVLKEHEDRREESRQRFEFELRQKDEEAIKSQNGKRAPTTPADNDATTNVISGRTYETSL